MVSLVNNIAIDILRRTMARRTVASQPSPRLATRSNQAEQAHAIPWLSPASERRSDGVPCGLGILLAGCMQRPGMRAFPHEKKRQNNGNNFQLPLSHRNDTGNRSSLPCYISSYVFRLLQYHCMVSTERCALRPLLKGRCNERCVDSNIASPTGRTIRWSYKRRKHL